MQPTLAILGIDEAGYGPKLGPLVVAGSLWEGEFKRERCDNDLDDFAPWSTGVALTGLGSVRIADSKQIYHSGSGLALLEASVLAATMKLWHGRTQFWDVLTEFCGEDGRGTLPWYCDWDPPLLAYLDDKHVAALAKVDQQWSAAPVQLTRVVTTIVEPESFNQRCDVCGNKSTLLTELSLHTARRLLEPLPHARVEIFCDKHGGRNFYAAALLHFWPDTRMEILCEGAATSRYRLTMPDQREWVWNFSAKGDRFVPTACASMVAKWSRERLMEGFNRYWCQQVPDLKPTAGYPADATRFLQAIEPLFSRLGIRTPQVVRQR